MSDPWSLAALNVKRVPSDPFATGLTPLTQADPTAATFRVYVVFASSLTNDEKPSRLQVEFGL
jgi:hypothetical protein